VSDCAIRAVNKKQFTSKEKENEEEEADDVPKFVTVPSSLSVSIFPLTMKEKTASQCITGR
jgi:hypothetical protein